MASKNTQLKARGAKGDELYVSHNQTDSPIIDVASLEKLHTFRPDIVDFVIKETETEAKYRRRYENKVSWFIFIERMGGILLAAIVCAGGIFGSVYAANQGHENLAITIVVSCIGTLAVAYLQRRR